jgi:hypothetical protein
MMTGHPADLRRRRQNGVAHTLSNNGGDQAQFAPLLDAIKTNLGRNPAEVSARYKKARRGELVAAAPVGLLKLATATRRIRTGA